MAAPRNVRLLVCFRFCSGLRFSAALLIVYFAGVSGSYTLGMSVFAVTSVTQALCDVPTGVLSDMLGRKPIVILGALTELLFTTCYAVGLNYGFLVAGAVLEGVARAFFSGNNEALLYDTLAEHDRLDAYATHLGHLSAAEQGAFTVAAITGGIMAHWSLHLVFWATLLPMSVGFLTTLALREPALVQRQRGARQHLRGALQHFRRNGSLRLLVTANALEHAVAESAYQFRQAFVITLWPLWALGVATTLSSAAAAAGFTLSGRVIRRFRALPVVIAEGIAGRAISVLALSIPTAASPALLASTSLTYGPAQVARGTLLQEKFTDAQRATLGSISSQATSLTFAVGAVAIGALADRVGPLQTLLIAQVALLAPLGLYWRLQRGDGRQRAAEAEHSA